jgi:acid stress-induced BolA-like protein IbaG/YrbA
MSQADMEIAIQRSRETYLEDKELEFVLQLSKIESRIQSTPQLNEIDVAGDGNCLFRCIAIIMFDDQKHHALVRDKMISFLNAFKERFINSLNLEESMDSWIGRMNNPGNDEFGIMGEYGDDFALELLAAMQDFEIVVSMRSVFDDELKIKRFGNPRAFKTINLILRASHFTLLQ